MFTKLNVNHEFFDLIDTEAKAYFLGWMISDGTVSTNQNIISLEVNIRDIEIIHMFREAISSNHKVALRDHSGKRSARIQFKNKHMHRSLNLLGVVPKKSLIAEAPMIQPDLQRHFWRGVVEGDGYIKLVQYEYIVYPALRLRGSRQLLEQFKAWSFSVVQHKTAVRPSREDRSYIIQMGGSSTVVPIVTELYQGAQFYLSRKYQAYLEIISQ